MKRTGKTAGQVGASAPAKAKKLTTYRVEFCFEIGLAHTIKAASPAAVRRKIEAAIDDDWMQLLSDARCVHFESNIIDIEEVKS